MTWIDGELKHLISANGADLALRNSIRTLEHCMLTKKKHINLKLIFFIMRLIDKTINDKEIACNAFKLNVLRVFPKVEMPE